MMSDEETGGAAVHIVLQRYRDVLVHESPWGSIVNDESKSERGLLIQ